VKDAIAMENGCSVGPPDRPIKVTGKKPYLVFVMIRAGTTGKMPETCPIYALLLETALLASFTSGKHILGNPGDKGKYQQASKESTAFPRSE
jgi:hypothetical protein